MASPKRSQKEKKQRTGYGTKLIDGNSYDIIECALHNDFDGVDEILKDDPEMINAVRKESGITALMAASGRGLEDMVGHLLKKDGIDVDRRDLFGKNALDHGNLFPQIVEVLMRHRLPNRKWFEPTIVPK